MAQLNELVAYTNHLLNISEFQDYCPNGLQVEGKQDVRILVSGVTASQKLLDASIAINADVILVHHGYFWSGENPCVVGMKRQRLSRLLASDISLLAYHLPLDAHIEYGNNTHLANRLGFTVHGKFGLADGLMIGLHGKLNAAMKPDNLSRHIENRLGRAPLHVSAGSSEIKTIAWCTGAAQNYIEAAADMGVQAFLTGEASEQTVHIARERGIHFYAAGHHATERYGPAALGEHLAEKFGLSHRFIDCENPV